MSADRATDPGIHRDDRPAPGDRVGEPPGRPDGRHAPAASAIAPSPAAAPSPAPAATDVPRLLTAIAGSGLRPGGEPAAGPGSDAEWQQLLARIDSEMLGGLAAQAVDAGEVVLTTTQQGQLLDRARAQHDTCLVAHACLVQAVQQLRAAAVDVRVLQGAAAAALDYPAPGLRLYRSVHLLVPPARLADAVAALEAAGAHRQREALSVGSRRRHRVTLQWWNGAVVELHRTLAPAPLGRAIDPVELFSGTAALPGGAGLVGLAAHSRLIAACIRARLDRRPPRLLALRDVVQLTLRPDLEVARVEALATSWGVEAVLADAVRRAWDLFSVPDVVPLSTWATRYRPERRERRRLALSAFGEERLPPPGDDGRTTGELPTPAG